MREADEPMECGIFDFYKVFSRAFGEEEDGVGGELEWEVGDVAPPIPRGKGRGCVQSADQLPALYLILRAGAGVDAGVGRAYGVRDF